MKNKFRYNEKGFALVLTLLLLVVMSVMATILITLVSNDHKGNTSIDSRQQTFYAAESGVSMVKEWMKNNSDFSIKNRPKNFDVSLNFCRASLFPNLDKPFGFELKKQSLIDLMDTTGASNEEVNRLKNYSFEAFVAYSPNSAGNNNFANDSAAKKNGKLYYTIYSCGCNESEAKCRYGNEGNIIVPLEAVVTLIN